MDICDSVLAEHNYIGMFAEAQDQTKARQQAYGCCLTYH